jgi:hypothetical protein
MNESVIEFGPGQRLVGTLLQTNHSNQQNVAMIVFNAGLIPRTGPHRLWVKLTRHVARQGITSLRFDLSGEGDSLAATSPKPYELQSIEDVKTAMTEVEQRTGIKRFVLAGICSGAAISYKAALGDERVISCMWIDSYMYRTRRTQINWARYCMQREGLTGLISRRLKQTWSATDPKRSTKAQATSTVLPGLNKPTPADYATGLKALLNRNTQLLMLYTGSYLYAYNYTDQFNDFFAGHGLRGKVHVEFVPTIDHTLTERSAQDWLVKRLAQWMTIHH